MRRWSRVLHVFVLAVALACCARPEAPEAPDYDRTSFAPYWYIDGQTQTVIEIKNVLDRTVAVQPVLRTQAGEDVRLDPVSIPPRGLRRVAITPERFRGKDAASATKESRWGDGSVPSSHIGSAELHVLRPDEAGADNLAAWILVESEELGLGFVTTFHSAPREDQSGQPASEFNGMWWLPSKEARTYYALQNTYPEALDVHVALSADKGMVAEKSFRIPAGHSHLLDIRSLVETGTAALVGGIKVRHRTRPGGSGGLLGRGLVIDEGRQFSTPLNLYKAEKDSIAELGTAKRARSELHAPLAYFGPLSRLVPGSKDVMTPHLLISNTSSAEISLEGSVQGRSSYGEAAASYLPTMTLPGHSSRLLDLMELRGEIGDGVAGVELWHDSGPNDVIAEVINVSESWDLALYDRTTNTAHYAATDLAAISLRLDEAAHSFLILKNTTDRAQQPEVLLDVGGQSRSYAVPEVSIPPRQVTVIDLKALRDEQVADDSGMTLPRDLELASAMVIGEPGAIVGSDPSIIFKENNTQISFHAVTCMTIVTQEPPGGGGGGSTPPACRVDAIAGMTDDGMPLVIFDEFRVGTTETLAPPLELFTWTNDVDIAQPPNVDFSMILKSALNSQVSSLQATASVNSELFCQVKPDAGCTIKLRCLGNPSCQQDPNHGCPTCEDQELRCLAGATTCNPSNPNSNEWAEAKAIVGWAKNVPPNQLEVEYTTFARTGGPDPEDRTSTSFPSLRILYECR